MRVVVVGGGSAGMLAAISASSEKCDVVILEKMNNVRKKVKHNRER